MEWIEENYEYILSTLKKYNPNNNIIFLGDEQTVSKKIKIYHVPIDDGDKVSRQPIFNNKELYPILAKIDFPGKENNLKRYRKKECKKFFKKAINKIRKKFNKIFRKEYCHTKTY